MAPGICSCNLKLVIFQNPIKDRDILNISDEFALRRMPQDLTDD